MNSQASNISLIVLKGLGCLVLLMIPVAAIAPIFMAAKGGLSRESLCISGMCQIAKAILSYTADYDDKFPCTRAPGAANGLRPERGIEARTGAVPFGGTTWVEKIDPYLNRGAIIDGPKGAMGGVLNCPDREMEWTGAEEIRDYHSYGYNFLFLGLPWDQNDAPETNPYRTWKFTSGVMKVQQVDDRSHTILLVESQSVWAFPPYTNDGRALAQNRTCISPRHNGRVNVAFCDGHAKSVDPRELVAAGRPLKIKGVTGAATSNRLWDPAKTNYPEGSK